MEVTEVIKRPISAELKEFNQLYNEVLENDNDLLCEVHNHIVSNSGKKLRPILTLLSAKIFSTPVERTRYAAFSMELLHTASLVHDDVIDHTLERRGKQSVNALWGNKVSVLTGDYLLSKSLYCATKTSNIDIVEAVANIGMILPDGELLQLAYNEPTKVTEEMYFTLIKKKTALLFATCTKVGAISVQAEEEDIIRMQNYGEALGICFQIQDDIFDYYEDIDIGKPTGNDLRDNKMTLPLIYALRTAKTEEATEIKSLIEHKKFDQENMRKIMTFAKEKGGIEYAKKRMDDYKNRAIEILEQYKDSDVKQALIACVEFTTSRKF